MAVIDISSTSPWAQEGAAVSGNYAALPVYNSESAAITKSGGGTFSFDDTYLKGWTTSTTGHILGYLNGTLVGDVSYGVSGSAWTDVSVHFSNVDQVMINGLNGFLLDNSTVNEVRCPRTLHMGDDDPRLRWRWFHGVSAEVKAIIDGGVINDNPV